MGCTHFLTRGVENVSTETSLSVLAYNLKRVIASVARAAANHCYRPILLKNSFAAELSGWSFG